MPRDVLICRISVQLGPSADLPIDHRPVGGMGSPVGEDRVKALIDEAIATACAPSGAVHAAVLASITKEVGVDGTIGVAATRAVGEGLSRATRIPDFQAQADADFPFRKVLRNLSPDQIRRAWFAIMVDTDQLEESVTESLADPKDPMATIYALHAAHPSNSELSALKSSAALRHAARTTWKQLCFPEQGGGPDRLQVYLGERAESSDQAVRALARAILALYHLIEKRATVLASKKKTAPAKHAAQKLALMPYVYECIKSFKRRCIKPSAAVALDSELLLRDFGIDLILGSVALETKAATAPSDSAGAGASGQVSGGLTGAGPRAGQVRPRFGPRQAGEVAVPSRRRVFQTSRQEERS